MNRRFNGLRLLLGVAVGWTALVAVPAAEPPEASEPERAVVMTGLDNPRGLALGPEGAVYVAEAGRGGPTTGADALCKPLLGPGGMGCYGPSGAVSRLWRGQQSRVMTGMPSLIRPNGDVGGPHDVSPHGWFGTYVLIGLGGTPAQRDAFGPAGRMLGTLVHAFPFGRPRIVADPAGYEGSANPDGGMVDSNPFGLLVHPFAAIVADAGGNSIVRYGLFSGATTLGVLPRVTVPPPFTSADPVPTSIVRGPDGAYYIGQLTGVPFAAAAASVYRLVPGGLPTVFQAGFTTITDLDFGPDGSLYVLEHSTGPVFFGAPGRVVKISPNGMRTFPIEGLNRPTSVVVDCKGTLYVTNNGISIGTGEVIRLRNPSWHHGRCD